MAQGWKNGPLDISSRDNLWYAKNRQFFSLHAPLPIPLFQPFDSKERNRIPGTDVIGPTSVTMRQSFVRRTLNLFSLCLGRAQRKYTRSLSAAKREEN